jgi:hypothetical protein
MTVSPWYMNVSASPYHTLWEKEPCITAEQRSWQTRLKTIQYSLIYRSHLKWLQQKVRVFRLRIELNCRNHCGKQTELEIRHVLQVSLIFIVDHHSKWKSVKFTMDCMVYTLYKNPRKEHDHALLWLDLLDRDSATLTTTKRYKAKD